MPGTTFGEEKSEQDHHPRDSGMSSLSNDGSPPRSPMATDYIDVDEAKEYMSKHVDPVISELLTELVVEKPENVVKYMLEWCRRKREDDPEVKRLREQAAKAYRQTQDRPVTPPHKKGERASYAPRNLSYVGTLGGGGSSGNTLGSEGGSKEGDNAGGGGGEAKVLTAAERREAMLAAAERRNNAGVFGARNISEEKRKEMALAKKRDKMIGKIRALYAASGKDEPFGLGMAKMEILQMHLDRAKGVTSAALKERAREGAAANAIKL